MKKKSIPTFIGLFVLIFGLAAGLLLIQGRQIFRLGATSDFSPQDVVVSNVSDNSFTVSWVTGREALSFIKWGKTATNLDKKTDSANKNPSFIHSISVSGLTPNTNYFIKINSGGQDFDNGGNLWQISTGSALAPPETINVVSGSVLTGGGSPVSGALVYLSAEGALLSTTTSQNGNWVIPLSSARTQDLTSYAPINGATTLLEIVVNAGPTGIATAQIYPQSARPAPAIVLGEVNDFKNAPISLSSGLPEANVQVPGETEPVSGFNVEGVAPVAGDAVTLESVDQGEVVTSTSPEFFGEGPVGETITITVESETQTAEITVPVSGDWKWSPPNDLPEGTHKIKISWRDAGGILRTIERTFVVQAAEGPAFESTPSGSASPTASPTGSPKASPTATPSGTPKVAASATSSATPSPTLDPNVSDSGILTPTIALSIMGIGLLAFSLFILKESSV